MISLNVYLSTTGGSKRDIMKAFGQGVSKHGVEVSYVDQHNYIKSDFAMVFAKVIIFNIRGYRFVYNHRFRQEVVDRHNDNIFFVDSNVLKAYEKDVRYFRFYHEKDSIFTHTKQII